jgi:hypothetical protein
VDPEAPDAITIEGGRVPPAAVAYAGQFRIALTDVVITESRSFAGVTRKIHLPIGIQAPPGARPMSVGAWRVEEAVDDQGVSMKREAAAASSRHQMPEPEAGDDVNSVWFTGDRYGRDDMRFGGLSINPPSDKARRIASLKVSRRVTFPMEEVTRTVNIEDIEEGTALRFGGTDVQILKVTSGNGTFELEYSVSGAGRGTPTFTLLDVAGTPIQCHGYGSSGDGKRTSCDWNFSEGTAVAAVRTHATVGHRTLDLQFELRDIPLPEER